MATGFISLFPGGTAPDGSGAGNNTAALSYEVSAGVQATNTPKAMQLKLLFDAATDEHWMFAFLLPGDYASGGTLRGAFKMTSAQAAGADVQWKGSQVTTADAATDVNKIFETAVTALVSVASDAAGLLRNFIIALTTTGMAANRKCVVFIGRDADAVADDAAGDAELVVLTLEYVTT